MFIFIGIISILGGVFAFRQASALNLLSSLARSSNASAVTGGFSLAAVLMILGGAFCIASSNGQKRGLATAALVSYVVAAGTSLLIGVGDLQIYGAACAIVAIIIGIWLKAHKD